MPSSENGQYVLGGLWRDAALEQCLEHGLLSTAVNDSAARQGAVTHHLLLFYTLNLQGEHLSHIPTLQIKG